MSKSKAKDAGACAQRIASLPGHRSADDERRLLRWHDYNLIIKFLLSRQPAYSSAAAHLAGYAKGMTMDKHVERHDDELIELGVASVDTKGVGILGLDEFGKQPQMGLSDD